MPYLDPTDITLIPAFTDWKSAAKAKQAFLNGRDFYARTFGSTPDALCSVRDFKPGSSIKIRYNNLRAITYVTIPGVR